jgi:putative NADH-flavin reductase
MRLLVLGAGGGTGRRLVKQAVEQRHEVTAFVHHRVQKQETGVRYVEGDVRDTELLECAVAGQEAVLDTLGTRRPFVKTTLETDAAIAVIGAMRRHGVRRILAISSIGVGDSIANVNWVYRMLIPVFFRGAIPDKERMEAALRSSGLEWTIVRPAGLIDGAVTGRVGVVRPESRRKVYRIARADVAAFVLQALEDNSYVRETVGLATSSVPGGPHIT